MSNAATSASASAAAAAAAGPDAADLPPEEEDLDALIELEHSLQAESQQAEEEAAAAAADGGGGFDPSEDGGGFFTEEQTAAGMGAEEPPKGSVGSLEEDAPARPYASGCRECGNVGVQQNFMTAFGVSVCYRCQRAHAARYALVTQTSCVHTYLLPVALVQARLGYIEKKNPHKQSWGVMKLYWRQQVLALVREKYGSVEALEAARQARDLARIAKDDAKRRAAHQAAAREAAFESTLAASVGELKSQTPSEVVAMLAQRTKGLGSTTASKRTDKRRRGKAQASDDAAEDDANPDEFDPLAGLTPAARKKAKKADAAKAQQTKQLHVHTFAEQAGKRACTQCGFVEEFEEF